VAQWR